MQGLPVALQPYAKGDVERFEGLVEGLAAANLHHVAKTVRDQRAGMDIPSHNLYAQQGILAGRGDAFSPIYVTPKGAHGARRRRAPRSGHSSHRQCTSPGRDATKSSTTISGGPARRGGATPTVGWAADGRR